MPTKVTYAMIESAPANVRDYGAVGNGVADDTAALQAAIAASTNVFFPAGVYRITSTLVIRNSCYWRGEAGTVIEKVGVGAAINDTNTGVNDAWIIENMTIRASTQPAVLDSGLAIGMGRSRRSVVRNVDIQFFATGIVLDQPDPLIGNYYNHIEDVRVYGATNEAEATAKNVRGIVLKTANANYLENCEIYGYNNRGIEIGAVGCQLKACLVQLSKQALYVDAGASNNNIEVYAEASTGSIGRGEVGSENNNIWIYRDGSGTNFDDQGYNSVANLTSLTDEGTIQRNGGFQYVTGAKGYVPAAGTVPVFKLVLPDFTQLSLEINAIATLPSINNFFENSRYVASYLSTTAVLTQKEQTTAGGGGVFTTSVSGNEITFSAPNSAGATGNPVLRYCVQINGAGLKSSPGYNWVKTRFVLL